MIMELHEVVVEDVVEMPIEIKAYMCSYCGEMFDNWRKCYDHECEKHDCVHCKNVRWIGPCEYECSKRNCKFEPEIKGE